MLIVFSVKVMQVMYVCYVIRINFKTLGYNAKPALSYASPDGHRAHQVPIPLPFTGPYPAQLPTQNKSRARTAWMMFNHRKLSDVPNENSYRTTAND